MLRAFSLGLKFLLELAAFAAFAYCGANVGSGVISVVLAIAAPALAIVLWGRFAAPRSDRRLATRDRIAFELSVFGLACVALLVVGARVAAAALAVLVAISTVLLTTRSVGSLTAARPATLVTVALPASLHGCMVASTFA